MMIELAYHKHRMNEAKQLELAWRERCAKLEAALQSIAANSCCGTCREAALVARDALKGGKGKRK